MALLLLLPVVSNVAPYLNVEEFCNSANCCKGVQVHSVRVVLEKKRTIFYRSVIRRMQLNGMELLWSWQRRTRVVCTECGTVDQWVMMSERGTTGLYKCSTCDYRSHVRNPFRRGRIG